MLYSKLKFLSMSVCVSSAAYLLIVSLLLRCFISELIFSQVAEPATQETARYLVKNQGNEVLIRRYGADNEPACVVFFPGQSGGIPRYEMEVFQKVTEIPATVFAVSLPGYEGAKGQTTLGNIFDAGKSAVEFINQHTSCKIPQSVFAGRSLGAMLALHLAAEAHPKGLLLDSTAVSLESAVRRLMQNHPVLQPALILPIAKLLAENPTILEVMPALATTPIVIFQAEGDKLTPYNQIAQFAQTYPNIELIKVANATHSSAQVVAGAAYFAKLEGLLRLP